MEQQKTQSKSRVRDEELSLQGLQRRKFLSYLGLSASVITIGAACTKEISGDAAKASLASNASSDCVDLGSGDVGILNYAYALEQLEAAFYTMVMANFYADARPREMELFNDIKKHEIAHREFFKTALGTAAIPDLEVDFSAVNFNSRMSVIATAKTFEDLGVAAYNGAGQLLSNPDYLLLAGKIVSVEARHAAWVRDLINPNAFARDTVVDMNGLDRAFSPMQVLAKASPFIKTKICADNLPTA
jgi:hypothetical protein